MLSLDLDISNSCNITVWVDTDAKVLINLHIFASEKVSNTMFY